MIIKMALQAADAGTVKLLLFLAFLSANLAVLNALPIPVLDGGHFVLLCYEGIRGKPADERVQAVLAYVGLALILALMVWVLGLGLRADFAAVNVAIIIAGGQRPAEYVLLYQRCRRRD